MSGILTPSPTFQTFTQNGQPNAFGTLFTYAAGTSTPIATYTDATLATPNPNPLTFNAIGQAVVWLAPGFSYKFTWFDQSGNQIDSRDQINAAFTLNNSLIPAANNTLDIGSPTFQWRNGYFGTNVYIGGQPVFTPQTAAEIAASVTPSNYGYAPGDIRRYGAACDGVTDDLAPINKAILVASQSAIGGGVATAPAGTIFHSAAITMKPLVCLRGTGKDSTIFLSTHTGAGIVTTSALNGSTGVYTEIRDCRFKNTNGSNTNGGVVDIAGSEVIVRNVSTLGFKYGIIFDQTELADIYLCEIANFLSTGGGIWLTNGADYSVGSNAGFTNRISVRSCQINGGLGGIGIIDDGGVAHTYDDNNFNACATHMRICGSTVPSGPGTSVRIANSEFESNTSNSIIFANTTYVLGTARGLTTNAVIDRNFFSPGASFSVSIAAASLFALQFSNNHTISSTPTVSGTANLNSLMAFDNIDSNAGALFDATATSHIETGVVNTTTTIKNTNLALVGAVAVTGTLSSSSRAQFNGAAGAALVTGFGTPTGTGVVANFPGATATLAQATQTIAELILILKNTGILGA